MVDELIHWHEGHAAALEARGIETRLRVDPSERSKRAARVDFRRGARIGTVLVWTNGDCELDALNQAGDDIVSEYRTVVTSADLDDAVAWVVARL